MSITCKLGLEFATVEDKSLNHLPVEERKQVDDIPLVKQPLPSPDHTTTLREKKIIQKEYRENYFFEGTKNQMDSSGLGIKEQSKEPIIKVTIGRIDVHAVQSQPLQVKTPKKAYQPALSLDDYLKERREGIR